MSATALSLDTTTIHIEEQIEVRASIEVTFAALLDQLGPYNETQVDKPMPMKLEAWPGGRWYRDLGDNNGHYWGTVQAIKKPTLLEICGPLFMSNPVITNLQYRLKESGGVTIITFRHQSLVWCWRSTETQRMAGHTCTSVCGSERKRRGRTEARTTWKFRGGNYVPSMHRKRSSDGRRSGIHGRNSGGVHRQIQRIFQGEWSRSVSENRGEIKWQQARRETWSTAKGISQ